MFDYVICEISGKQYLIKPGQEFNVGFLGDSTSFECDKVIMVSENGKISLGTPYLKTPIKFEVTGDGATKKIRVMKYKSKANFRKVTGSKQQFTKVVMSK